MDLTQENVRKRRSSQQRFALALFMDHAGRITREKKQEKKH